MAARSVLLALIFLTPILAQWQNESAVAVVEVPYKITFQRMYADPSNNWTHFIYATKSPKSINELYYVALYPNDTVSAPRRILAGQRHNLHSDIYGANDGKRIFIAVCALRTKGDPPLSDVYIVESEDGGASFGIPVAVPRADLNDKANREQPAVRYSPSKDRVWLFYYKNTTAEKREIAYVTKPKDSLVYSPEKSLGNTEKLPDSALRLEIMEEDDGTSRILAGYYAGDVEYHVFYVYVSANSGVSWNIEKNGRTSVACTQQIDLISRDDQKNNYYTVMLCQSASYQELSFMGAKRSNSMFMSIGKTFDSIRAKMCKVDVGYLSATFITGNQVEIYRTFGKVVLYDHDRSKGVVEDPFPFHQEKDRIAHLYYPDLACWYSFEEKSTLRLSVIGIKMNGVYTLMTVKRKVSPLSSEKQYQPLRGCYYLC